MVVELVVVEAEVVGEEEVEEEEEGDDDSDTACSVVVVLRLILRALIFCHVCTLKFPFPSLLFHLVNHVIVLFFFIV